MRLPRRFQNLISDCPYGGARWLRSVDLTDQLFGDTTPPPPSTTRDRSESAAALDSTTSAQTTAAAYAGGRQKKKRAAAVAADLNMERIRLSSPIFRFQTMTPPSSRVIDCFPLSRSKVAMADQIGRMFLCDAETRRVVPMPDLHKPKSEPISLFVPGADDADAVGDHPSGGGSLFVMERVPDPEAKCDGAQPSDQFEAFVPSKPSKNCGDLWHCRLLPAPPFVRDPAYWLTYPEITSYTVVGSHICISTKCNATTYRLDTKSNTGDWKVVKGKLPFYGKVEYVPELKLWFGLSSRTTNLAAADLSTMASRPKRIGGDWKEFDPPEEWMECDDPQIVSLGSGRFCITRFFNNLTMEDDGKTDRIVVFTGVEVAPVVHNGNSSGSGNGKVELQMKKHKSRYHMCTATIIHDVF